jgi:hypothetical protein
MDGEQAYLVVDTLERAIRAICRAHGDAIADFQGRVFPDSPPPPDAVPVRDRDAIDDDLPF